MTQLAGPTPEPSILGVCPNCGERIPPVYLLIEYQTSGGWTQMFAECPDCRDVVHPR